MADPKEPKKETVRITLPPRAASGAPPLSTPRDTVRINLPARPPANGGTARPLAPPPPRPPLPQPPPTFRPPSPPPAASFATTSPTNQAAAAVRAPEPVAEPHSAPVPGPKKETARISVLPDPPKPAGSVQMKKTQPLISLPEASAPVTPVTLAPRHTEAVLDTLPISLCWTLLGASALILLIQIWNYIS